MREKISIRQATTLDADVIFSFVKELEEQDFDRVLFDEIFLRNSSNADIIYSVACNEYNEVVGFISCHTQYLLHHLGLVAEIQELFVARTCQGKGIGSLLLKSLEEKLALINCQSFEVTAQNKREATHRFYEKHGFKRTHHKFTRSVK